MTAATQWPFDQLFPAELHAKVALEYEQVAAKLAEEIDSTNCPIRRSLLKCEQGQRLRNSIFHRRLADRLTSALGR